MNGLKSHITVRTLEQGSADAARIQIELHRAKWHASNPRFQSEFEEVEESADSQSFRAEIVFEKVGVSWRQAGVLAARALQCEFRNRLCAMVQETIVKHLALEHVAAEDSLLVVGLVLTSSRCAVDCLRHGTIIRSNGSAVSKVSPHLLLRRSSSRKVSISSPYSIEIQRRTDTEKAMLVELMVSSRHEVDMQLRSVTFTH